MPGIHHVYTKEIDSNLRYRPTWRPWDAHVRFMILLYFSTIGIRFQRCRVADWQ